MYYDYLCHRIIYFYLSLFSDVFLSQVIGVLSAIEFIFTFARFGSSSGFAFTRSAASFACPYFTRQA
jgi:hypothetical protein